MTFKHRLALYRRSGGRFWRNAQMYPPYLVKHRSMSCLVEAAPDDGSATCYREVIVEDSYGLFEENGLTNIRVAADIGANVGMFSRVFAHLFPGVEIYAYEPNPKAVEYLRKNAAGLSLHITQAAVNATGGMVHFNFSLDTTVGYISQDSPESCPAVSAQAVAEGKPIDFLKMDCEGGEWDILGDPSLLRRTRFLRMEYHLQNTRTLGDLEKLLQAGGHRLVKVTRTDPNHGMVWSVGTGGA